MPLDLTPQDVVDATRETVVVVVPLRCGFGVPGAAGNLLLDPRQRIEDA